MQLTRSGNNFWNTGAFTSSTFGVRSNSSYQPKVKVVPYTRLNATKDSLRRLEGFISDGTALNMCDPNSMRN